MYIVIIGNIVDGSTFFGTFDTPESATEYAESENCGQEWQVVRLSEPAADTLSFQQ